MWAICSRLMDYNKKVSLVDLDDFSDKKWMKVD
jgi:hypothetical protein